MLRMFRSKAPPADQEDTPRLRQRVQRLEIELSELAEKFEAHRHAYGKFQAKVYGHLGAPNRDAVRNSRAGGETLEEYRDRMLRSGQLRPTAGEDQHGSTQ